MKKKWISLSVLIALAGLGVAAYFTAWETLRKANLAMDVPPGSVKMVSEKVQRADLKNVRVVRGDVLETGLDADSFDTLLLLGVIPAPMLPLVRLLPEMHRVLKAGRNLAVWPPVPGWLPRSILNSGLFAFANKVNGVYNYKNNDKEVNLT
jgi:hypothetical protein